MKGLEFKIIFGLIILVAVVLLVSLIVFNPALAFGKTTSAQISFEEFCIYWSLNGYQEGKTENVKRNGIDHGSVSSYCSTALKKLFLDDNDIDVCRKCCKKEIAC
jgi:hypothetical protein